MNHKGQLVFKDNIFNPCRFSVDTLTSKHPFYVLSEDHRSAFCAKKKKM